MAENAERNGNCVEGKQYNYKDYKVALAGDYGVGKTSLFRRMFNMGFCDEKPPSAIEYDIHRETFENKNTVIGLKIYDTVDMEKHDSITQSYYRGSCFVLLVYDSAEFSSLQKLCTVAKNVRYYEPMSKLILVRNKTDLDIGDDGVTPDKEDRFICNLKHKICAKFSTSAKNNDGISEMLREVAKQAFKLRGHIDYANDPFAVHLDSVEPPDQRGCCS